MNTYKKLLGVIVFLNILLFIYLGCVSLIDNQTYFQHINKMALIYKASEGSIVPNQNFIFLKKYIYKDSESEINCNPAEKSSGCHPTQLYTTASGIAIGNTKNKLKILTAAHWCYENFEDILYNLDKGEGDNEYFEPFFYYEADYYGLSYKAKIIDIELSSDLCMLSIETSFANQAKEIKVAKHNPNIGDSVYAIAAPQSVTSHKTRFHFHGSFAGCDESMIDMPFCFYSLPAAPGSSGSGIFNANGDLIGILSISIQGFENISGGPKPYLIEQFIKENKYKEL
tara:strand:- start:1764 stop:2615 length:852 start_codon:yes stop_codon:yes gene_type:complete